MSTPAAPSLLSRAKLAAAAARTAFGYNAISDKGRRQSPQAKAVQHEDVVLDARKRKKLIATSRDAARNMSLLAWAVRKHLDYVSRFDPHITGLPDELTDWLNYKLEWHGRKQNFDLTKRHSRTRSLRLFETAKVLDGDGLMISLATGRFQTLEGTRLAQPTDLKASVPEAYQDRVTVHGLVLDEEGATEKYCICKRKGAAQTTTTTADQTLVFDKLVDESNLSIGSYITRCEQTRGVSPLASALNTFADLYEAWEWTLIKIKLHALFGVAITRDGEGADGFPTMATADADTDEEGGETPENRYDVNLQGGVMMLDMEPGDSANLLESKTPNSQVIPYSELMARVALLALDIPFTFFDSNKASFSARIADRVEYEESARQKREDNQSTLVWYSDRMVERWAKEPDLATLLTRHGLTATDVQRAIEWVPTGTPWLDKLKEVTGDAKAIAAGLDSIPRVVKRRTGAHWKTIAQENKEAQDYYAENGIYLMIGDAGQTSIQEKEDAEETEQEGTTDEDSPET